MQVPSGVANPVPEDLSLSRFAEQRQQRHRESGAPRLVSFADLAVGIGARSVGSSAGKSTGCRTPAVPLQHFLHDPFSFRRMDSWVFRMVLRDGTAIGSPYIFGGRR